MVKNIIFASFYIFSASFISVLHYNFYLDVVYPKYAYMGFIELKDSRAVLLGFTGCLNGLAYHYLVRDKLSALNVFACMYFNIVLMPATIFIFATDLSFEAFSYYLMLYIYPVVQRLPLRKTLKAASVLSDNFIIFISLTLAAVIFLSVPPSASVFGIADVAGLYDIRMSSRDQLAEASPVVAYSYMLTLKVLAPILLSYGLFKRNRVMVSGALIIFVLGFLVSAHKSIILTPLAIIALYYGVKNSLNIKFWLFSGVLALSILAYLSVGPMQLVFGEILLRRLILVPGMLTETYFSYFSADNFNYFNSLTSKLTGETHKSIAFIIGENLYGNPDSSANANFVASGYAELGFTGVVLYSIIILICLQLLDSRSDLEKKILLVASFPVLWALLESNLLTVFITHGLLCLLLVRLLWKTSRV